MGHVVATGAFLVTGCSSNPTTLTPQPRLLVGGATAAPHATATPKAGPTGGPAASPTPTPLAAGSVPSAATIAAAAVAVQNYFAALPTTSYPQELAATAAYMVASKQFETAVVAIGGISATLPGGFPVEFFADRGEEMDGGAPVGSDYSGRRSNSAGASVPQFSGGVSAASTQHEVAYLFDNLDRYAFNLAIQQALAGAWTVSAANTGAANSYEIDAMSISLQNLATLGPAHPLDYLGIATHGMVAVDPKSKAEQFIFLSTTRVSDESVAQYRSAIQSKLLYAAATIVRAKNTDTGPLPTFAFTPQYLVSQARFNAGAYVDNQSCFGQYADTTQSVSATFGGAGAAWYSGWTYPVLGHYADGSDVFLIDRLLGEPSAKLAQYVPQRSPLQRPFDLADVIGVMNTEVRPANAFANGAVRAPDAGRLPDCLQMCPGPSPSPSSEPSTYTYAQAPGISYFPLAQFKTSRMGTLGDDIAVPTIETMSVVEGAPSTLTIAGEFPAAQGEVDLTVAAGPTKLPIASWSTTSIVANLPTPSGSANLGGQVNVVGPTGLASNGVPLTYWPATVKMTEQPTNGSPDTGSAIVTLNAGFRSDVAPTVVTIDTAPVAQNLTIEGVTPNSTASVSYSGSFSGAGTPYPSAVATLTYGAFPGSSPSFTIASVQRSSDCNNAQPGPQGGSAPGVTCVLTAFQNPSAVRCSDDVGNMLCAYDANFLTGGLFVYSNSAGNNNYIDAFTMNPTTYAITVPGVSAVVQDANFGLPEANATSTTVTVGPPVGPPLQATQIRR